MKEGAKKKSRWRWVRRGVAVVIVLLVVIAIIPFVFTTPLVRFALRHSAYARFSPTISGASLSPGGSLDIRNLALHESGGGQTLVSVGDLRATFSWSGALRDTLKDIRADNVILYARPDEGDGLSFLQLAAAPAESGSPQAMAGPALAAATVAPISRPLWFDSLQCSGQIIGEPFPDFDLPAAAHPFTLSMAMRGDHLRPAHALSLTVGQDSANPEVLLRMQFEPLAAGQKIMLQSLSARHLAGGVTAAYTRRQFPHLPKLLQQSLAGSVTSLSASGVWDDLPNAPTLQAHVQIGGLEIESKSDAATPTSLKGLSLTADFLGPASPAFLQSGAITAGKLSLTALAYGKNSLEQLQSDVALHDGELEASNLTADFAGGAFTGVLDYSPAQNRLTRADLTVAHLDQQKVLANIAPDKIDGDGKLSGVIKLKAGEKTLLKGKIDLTSDGPGHLEIKDQDAAQMLAQSLQTPPSTGILPDNFSDIVVGQLRNYPYRTAHIKVADHQGGPLLSLDYTRDGVTKGQPGFAVKATVAGQQVLANYTIQLPGVTVVLRGKTIEELLQLAAGLGTEIAHGNAAGTQNH